MSAAFCCAREQGFGVPEDALKKANERLLRYLQERQLIEVNYSDNANHSRFAVQAYAAYVLAPMYWRAASERRWAHCAVCMSDAAMRCPACRWCTGRGLAENGRSTARR